MPNTEKMSRLNIAIPEELHRQIKAAASLQGKTIKDYIIERVLPSEAGFDLDDVNTSLAVGLKDVAAHKNGGINLPTYQEFLAQTK